LSLPLFPHGGVGWRRTKPCGRRIPNAQGPQRFALRQAEKSSEKPPHSKSCLPNALQSSEEFFVLILKHGPQVKEQGVLFNPGDNRG
jgi:hypothetical protein